MTPLSCTRLVARLPSALTALILVASCSTGAGAGRDADETRRRVSDSLETESRHPHTSSEVNAPDVVSLSVSPTHLCVRHRTAGTSCLGSNQTGALGTTRANDVSHQLTEDDDLEVLTTGDASCLVGEAGVRCVGGGDPAASPRSALEGLTGRCEMQGGSHWVCGVCGEEIRCVPQPDALRDESERPYGFPLPTPGARIAVGDSHQSCASGDGSAWCWRGAHLEGQQGITRVAESHRVQQVAPGSLGYCILDMEGAVWCVPPAARTLPPEAHITDWLAAQHGRPIYSGALVRVEVPRATELRAGAGFYCALSGDAGHELWCWGSNAWRNHREALGEPVERPLVFGSDVTAFDLGASTLCTYSEASSEIRCWGALLAALGRARYSYGGGPRGVVVARVTDSGVDVVQ